jgi:hypothetical protein
MAKARNDDRGQQQHRLNLERRALTIRIESIQRQSRWMSFIKHKNQGKTMTSVLMPAGLGGPLQISQTSDPPCKQDIDTLPRRTSDASPPRTCVGLQGAVDVGEPPSPRKQDVPCDPTLMAINQPIAKVVASDALCRQVAEHFQSSNEAFAGGTIYAPLVSPSGLTAAYDGIRGRISIDVPGANGARTEVRLILSSDGKSVAGMEMYGCSAPQELPFDSAAVSLVDAEVLNQKHEVKEQLLDGDEHTKLILGVPTKVRYDTALHQLCISGLDPDGAEIRLSLRNEKKASRTGAVAVHRFVQSGPQHVSTETLGKLVEAGFVQPEMLAIRLASQHTPRAMHKPRETEASEIASPDAARPKPVTRIPSPTSRVQSPLNLRLDDVVAHTELRNQIRKTRLTWGSDAAAKCETFTTRYDAETGLVWLKAGADPKAPLVRIKLSPDKKAVLWIDEPKIGAEVASAQALASLIEAGVLRPGVLNLLHPQAAHVDEARDAMLRSADSQVRLKAALGIAMYGTATPARSEQKLKVEEWADFLLWQIELPTQIGHDARETAVGETAIIDLRSLYTKSQTDLLATLGAVGWQALFARAREIGAKNVLPLFKGPGAAKLINAAKAAVPELERAGVSADAAVDGAIRVDLDELTGSAPAISIRIEDAEDGQVANTVEVWAPPGVTVALRRSAGASTIDQEKMTVSRRTDDPEVRISEPLRYEAG